MNEPRIQGLLRSTVRMVRCERVRASTLEDDNILIGGLSLLTGKNDYL
jgi:hypothetical protein